MQFMRWRRRSCILMPRSRQHRRGSLREASSGGFAPQPEDRTLRTLSLIFPMAGQGARFGYRFKPFLDVRGQTFIEAAFLPFRPWLAQIANVHFVFTREQDAAHDVRARLWELFPDVPHEATVLDAPTQGPAQTLDRCLEMKAVSGPVMV